MEGKRPTPAFRSKPISETDSGPVCSNAKWTAPVAVRRRYGQPPWPFGSETSSASNCSAAAGDLRSRLGLPDAPTGPAHWQESSGNDELGPPVNIPSISEWRRSLQKADALPSLTALPQRQLRDNRGATQQLNRATQAASPC